MEKLQCPKCWEWDRISIVSYRWAYDWWLELECPKCSKYYHRNDLVEIKEYKQPKEYWPVFYKVKWDKYYKNLTEITKEEYVKSTWMI